jgi:hypothetical protein
LPPTVPLACPVAFAIPTTMPTDAAATAADATAVRPRDNARRFTSLISSEASVMDSPLHVDAEVPRRGAAHCG